MTVGDNYRMLEDFFSNVGIQIAQQPTQPMMPLFDHLARRFLARRHRGGRRLGRLFPLLGRRDLQSSRHLS